jgi:hypothetical protein
VQDGVAMIAGTRTDASLFHSTPIEASEMLPGNPESQHRGRPKQHSKTALSPEKPPTDPRRLPLVNTNRQIAALRAGNQRSASI